MIRQDNHHETKREDADSTPFLLRLFNLSQPKTISKKNHLARSHIFGYEGFVSSTNKIVRAQIDSESE